MTLIDVESLREHMEDYIGTAMMNGFPAALLDLADIDSISGEELCEKAEQMGVDLNDFVVDEADEYFR